MQKDVLARRGWNREAVDRFLPQPDQMRRVGWPWAKLYEERRVVRIEASLRWRRWLGDHERLLARYDKREALARVPSPTPEETARREAERQASIAAAAEKEVNAYVSANPGLAGTLTALHFVNRYAKHDRSAQSTIYLSKNWFLRAAVAAGIARVYTFVFGRRCFIVEFANGMRFHQPGESAPHEWMARATEIEGHDPTQPLREIPSIGVSWQTAVRVIDRAAAELRSTPALENVTHEGGASPNGE